MAQEEPLTLRDVLKQELSEADHITQNNLNGLLLHVEELRMKIKNASTGTSAKGRQLLRDVYKTL